jgi:hypothetical protein
MTILGYPGMTEQGRKIIRDPVRGVFTEILYEGPKESIYAAFSTIPTSVYCEVDTMRPNPLGTMMIRTPDYGSSSGTSEVQTTWDLPANLTQKHIFEHPKSQALGAETLSRIWAGFTGNAEVSGLNANGTELLQMLKLRQDTFFVSQPVFKHSSFIQRNGVIAVAHGSVGRVYSSASVITETGAPSVWQSAINSSYAAMLDFYGGSAPSGHTIGWLKVAPQFSGAAGNKTVVTVEYMLEAWRNYPYSA